MIELRSNQRLNAVSTNLYSLLVSPRVEALAAADGPRDALLLDGGTEIRGVAPEGLAWGRENYGWYFLMTELLAIFSPDGGHNYTFRLYDQQGPLAERPDGYVGFRLQEPDGWHYGWLRIRWVVGLSLTSDVTLESWLLHPQASQPVFAGADLFPPLHIEPQGKEVVVSWPPLDLGFILERTEDLGRPQWTPVAGVVDNRVSVPVDGRGAFFRLRRP